MRYIFDHDLHIHSHLSTCSKCPDQTPERIAQYAMDEGLHTVCLTDHFWDETVPGASAWYEKQNYPHICQAKPLPQPEGVRFLFGCETELDKNLTLGISRERMDSMDFINIPVTHFHMKLVMDPEDRASQEARVRLWLSRLDGLLSMELPFHKIGLAHLTCPLIAAEREDYLRTLEALPEDRMKLLFGKAAQVGVGIELNAYDIKAAEGAEDIVLRPYRIAKEQGCKFYCGSDSHSPSGFTRAKERFEKAISLLELSEEDKFLLPYGTV